MIADYRGQPYTTKFPRADIHELLTPDLLHQAIKGTFKDHLVEWIKKFLKIMHGSSKAEDILDEIDRWCVHSHIFILHLLTLHRIALAPLFPGLQRFKQSRN